MTLQEQTELACAFKCARAAHEAARATLALVSAALPWPELQKGLAHVASLRQAERTTWQNYLAACQLDTKEFQRAYEAQQRATGYLQAAPHSLAA